MVLRGWNLVGAVLLAVGAMVGGLLATYGSGPEGLGALLRWTARSSGLLFFAAFSASSLRRLRPAPSTRWLLANRRYLGISTAVSHTYHLGAVIALFAYPDDLPPPVVLGAAAVAFLFLYAMAATSSDRAVAWLGQRRWKRLHTVGGWYLWVIFTFTFSGGAAKQPLSALFMLLAFAVLGVRLAARIPALRPGPGA